MSALPLRTLGNSGLQVSCLGLGTVKIGRNTGVKYPAGFELPDDSSVRHMLAQAQDLGINFIDTAPAYGSSEERLGKLMARRQDWVICSKTGEEFSDGKSFFDFSAAHTRRSVERSLQRLRTDYIDLVLVHSDGNDQQLINQTDCFAELARLKQEGLIRAFGFSGKTVDGGLLAAERSDVVMVTCNPGYVEEIPVIARARQLNRGVLIKKAFNSGHAVAANTTDSTNEDQVTRNLRFIFQQPGVSSVIVGTINPTHLQQNVESAIRVLSP